MKNLLIRTVSGVFLATVTVLGVLYLNTHALKIIISLVAAVSIWELLNLFRKRFDIINIYTATFVGFLISLTGLFFSLFWALLGIFIYAFWQANKKWNLDYLLALVFIYVYGGILVSSIGKLIEIDRYIVLILFATVWAGDTFAYFFGKAVGKHKLAPQLSPKKTWEGAFGSVLGSLLFGGGLAYYLNHIEAVIPVFFSAIIMQIGDLFESFIKRQFGVKDSSNLIPGHGGVLDRIDALIFASVFFVGFYQVFKF